MSEQSPEKQLKVTIVGEDGTIIQDPLTDEEKTIIANTYVTALLEIAGYRIKK